MNEEKKLNDEAVKGVAGGNVQRTPQMPYYMFYNTNCKLCFFSFHHEEQQGEQSCPYNDPVDAYRKLDGAECPRMRRN